MIALLDDYFDALVASIEKRKGQILKFVRDGMLAIFPAEDDDDPVLSSLARDADIYHEPPRFKTAME